MMIWSNYFSCIVTLVLSILTGCHEKASSQSGNPFAYKKEKEAFGKYWYAGKAEIASYKLRQARYGEYHEGSAVLIFVTEPFSKDKQVKLDRPGEAGSDRVTVMKLNFTKKFLTGIYPYSMMCSVFTPVERDHFPHTLKVTMTSQEWCGHVFTQMNLRDDAYDVHEYSYFEAEGDEHFQIGRAMLEDEIWNMIRLAPEHLPEGSVGIIPGLFFTRLMHRGNEARQAEASRRKSQDGHELYRLVFPDLQRVLEIEFDTEFPYRILGWREQFTMPDGKTMTTSATLDRTLHTDYWNKNKAQFRYLRDSLGLSTD